MTLFQVGLHNVDDPIDQDVELISLVAAIKNDFSCWLEFIVYALGDFHELILLLLARGLSVVLKVLQLGQVPHDVGDLDMGPLLVPQLIDQILQEISNCHL